MANKLVEKREELRTRQKALAAIFEAAGSDMDLAKVKELDAFNGTAAKAAEIKRMNDELSAVGIEVEGLAESERIGQRVAEQVKSWNTPDGGVVHPTGNGNGQAQQPQKSLGEQFVESKAFTEFNGRSSPRVVLGGTSGKTLMTTTAGWAPIPELRAGFVPSAQRQPTVIEALPPGQTGQAAIMYMLETTLTNNAAARAEGANNAGEMQFVLTATTATVREFAAWLPVTREQMADAPQVSGYVNNRLPLALRQVMSAAILTGAGAPSFTGIIGLAGVQTQPLGADPGPDCIYKAMVLVQVTGRAEPNVTIWNPTNWQTIRLLRTVDGVYIWGSPADPGPARIWGLPVVQDSACTLGTALVGDFANFTELTERQGIEIEVSDSHAGLFIQRTLAILATYRAALIVYRPAAICQCTGLQ